MSDKEMAYTMACQRVAEDYPYFCDATVQLMAHCLIWSFEHHIPPSSFEALASLINALYESYINNDDAVPSTNPSEAATCH